MRELIGSVGEEQPGEPVVAGGDGQPGVAVVGLDDRDDLSPLGGMPRRLQGDIDRLAAAAAVDHLGQIRRRRGDECLRECRPRAGREVVVADVEGPHAGRDGLDKLGVPVPEVVGAAVEVHVDEPQARHVPDEVALPAVDDEVDAGLGPEVGLPRIPELAGLRQDLSLGLHAEDVVVVHRPAFVTGRRAPRPAGPVLSRKPMAANPWPSAHGRQPMAANPWAANPWAANPWPPAHGRQPITDQIIDRSDLIVKREI